MGKEEIKRSWKLKDGIITLLPLGGLIGRLGTVASAIHLAKKYNRPLQILWRMCEDFPCSYERLFYFSPHLISSEWGIELLSIRHAVWQDMVLNYPPSTNNLFATLPFTLSRYDRVVSIRKHNGGKEQLERLDLEELFKPQSERLLLASDLPLGYYPRMFNALEATAEVNNVLRSRMSAWKGNVVGVHINRSVTEGSVTDCPTELIIRRMQQRIEEDSNVHFFITTTSREEKERLWALFRERAIVAYSTYDVHSAKGIVDELGELLALSRTQHILTTKGSSFSKMAAEIGDVPLEVVSVFTESQLYH